MQSFDIYGLTDRTGWGSGPWDDEPDKKQWKDEATGLPCLIVRNPMGSLCGYVGVDSVHPYFGKDYMKDEIDGKVYAHGGITFSSKCDGIVCHEVEPGEDDNIWWFGFDCAHYMDICPTYTKPEYKLLFGDNQDRDQTYKDFAFVEAECRRLAIELLGIAPLMLPGAPKLLSA